MADRKLLKKNISDAWMRTVSESYPQQLINSERGLQVHFCHKLLEEFRELERRLFIEPSFKAADGTTRMPDIVICNSRRIIGVIELKYMPRATADYKKDLQTLQWFCTSPPPITLANERYCGIDEGRIKTYELADDAVLCWAGIYGGPRVDIEAQAVQLGSRFLCLHAITRPTQAPELFPWPADARDP